MFWALYAFIPWIMRNNISRSFPVVKGFFSQLRKDEDATLPVGAAGFCWGGKHALLLAQGAQVNGRSLVDAAFTGHPSWLEIPGDIEKLTKPVAFAIGDKDAQVSVEQAAKVKEIVEALPEEAKGEVRIYDNCGHGFCIRADVGFKDSEIARQAIEAEDQCIFWFNEQFKIRS
jgi:dienelactone hydrolase